MPSSSDYSSTARHDAQKILSKPPYTSSSHTPRPLAGLLHDIGQGLSKVFGPIGRWFERTFNSAGHSLSSIFGVFTPYVVILLAVGVGVLIAALLIRRRTRIASQTESKVRTDRATAMVDLDRQADEAEARGDHESAVRLRFQAGLQRLEDRGLVADVKTHTSTQISQTVASTTFDVLAGSHESIVFAEIPATPQDAAKARTEWPRVLVESKASASEHPS